MEISLFYLHHQLIYVLSRHTLQRIHYNYRKLHALRLMDRQERNTATRSILRVILILCDTSINEEFQIQIE